jgi:nucleoside-diphosphate-sugar epimerase
MRFTTVYGPGGRGNMMYDLLKDGKAKYVTNHKRDWIHVKDVCRAIRHLASSDDHWAQLRLELENLFL